MTADTEEMILGLGDIFPIPIARAGTADEVAALLAYLLGPDAGFFVGSFDHDGRRHRRHAASRALAGGPAGRLRPMAAFVPCSRETWRAPWSMYEALRDEDPVHHVEAGDYWVLSRFADVFAAARDTETFSSAQGLTFEYGEREQAGLSEADPMVMMDPPVHTAFRRLVGKGFTPRHVTEIEPAVRAFVVERVERLREAGRGDVVVDLFKPLPSFVVAYYLGVPEADWPRFDGWTEGIVAANARGQPAAGRRHGR